MYSTQLEAFSTPTKAPQNGGAPSKTGAKLRAIAVAMQTAVNDKFRDRQTNTPKRQREAASARNEGVRLQRTQQALCALATLHDEGAVPAVLRSVTTKKAAYELMGAEMDRSGGYYDAGRDLGRPSRNTPEALALWAIITAPNAADRQAEELRRKIDALQFASIPGYFPTPDAVIARMVALASLPVGISFDLLEPEGGGGAILDYIRARFPLARLTTYERHCSLREVLKLKGHSITGSDFMEAEIEQCADRVLMNPPFENGQDIDHVRRAFQMLRTGGKLIAVMSPGPFFRNDRRATEFRTWFDNHAGERFDLPAGSFKQSGTGIDTVVVRLLA